MINYLATPSPLLPPASRTSSAGRAFSRADKLALLAALTLYLGLALFRLGSFSLWLDEIMSLDFSDGSLGELITWLRGDVHSPAYYLLLMGFIHVFGISEWTARLPGVLLGAAALVFLFLLARRAAGARTAAYAALLLACSPFFIEFSREARPYVAAACLAAASWYFYLRLLASGRRADALNYACCTVLLPLTFYPGMVVPAAQALMLPGRRAAWRKWLLLFAAWLAAGVFFLAAWGPVLGLQLRAGQRGHFWLDAYYPNGIGARDVLAVLGDLFFGMASGGALGPALRGGLVAALALVATVLILAAGGKPRPRAGRLAVPLAMWSLWGGVGVFVLLCLVRPLLISRYLTLQAPFAAFYIALALARLPARAGRGALALLLAASLAGYAGYQRAMPREDWRGAALILKNKMKPKDLVVTESVTARSCLEYYFKILGSTQLANNVCAYDQFLGGTGGGRYPFSDRTLWFVASKPARQAGQLALMKAKNRLESQTALGAGFELLRFGSRGEALAQR